MLKKKILLKYHRTLYHRISTRIRISRRKNTTQSTSAVKEAIAKEEKRIECWGKLKSEALPKVDVTRRQAQKRRMVPRKIKTGAFTKMISLLWIGNKSKENGTTSIKMEIVFILLHLQRLCLWSRWCHGRKIVGPNLDNQWYYADSSGRLIQNTWKN